MNYRDEEDIFEEDIVFDQAGLLSTARKRGKSAIRRVSSGRCAMLSKTLALCGAFFGLGLSIALPGPATPMPPTDLDTESGGEEHIYRCLGFMLGSMLGGMLLDRFNRLFLVFLALLVCAILVAMVPWTGITWLLRSDLILLGATMGFLLTGGNVLCLDLWGQNSGPFMQALHFSFSLGAFLAPLIASPLSPTIPTVPPITEHHRLPRAVNDTNLAYAEGMGVLPTQPLSSIVPSKVTVPNITMINATTSLPFLQSLENNSSMKTSLSQDNLPASSSTTPIPHSTSHRVPKPKPEVNSGKNLEKDSKWERVPVSSTKATTATTSTSTTPASKLSTANVNKTSTPYNSTFTPFNSTSTSLPIQEIFQKEVSPSNNSEIVENDDKLAKNESKVSQEKVNVIASSTAATKTIQPEVKPSTVSTSTSKAPEISSSTTPKPSPPTPGTSTTAVVSSSTKSPGETKTSSTVSSTTASTPSSPGPTPRLLKSMEETLNPEPPVIAPRPSTDAPPASPSPSPSPSTPTTKLPSNVEVTSAPRRHHSKPTSYDNDTEEIHTVIDEVADHFGKEYGLSRLQLSYLLVALLLFVVSLLFLGFLCFNPRDPRSRSEDDVGGGRSNIIRPRWIRIMLTTLMMLVLALSAGVQFTYGQLLVLFAMRSPLALSLSTGTALTATFWGASTSTRLACILLASALSPGALLVISVALTAAATWLLSALAVQSAAALWVGAVLVAVGTASILPSSFLWMQQHVHVSHHVAGMLVMGPAMGEMLFPPLAVRIVKGVGPAGLLHLPALLSLAVIALWAAAWRLARHPCSSLCAHDDPAAHTYQLASQTDEDDLLDLTMSPVTHRGAASVARRASSHANGNGVHRLNT